MADDERQDRPAGAFAEWLLAMERALDGEADADVPCDGCTACCTSSQFVHIGSDETDALAHIPPALLFPAPGSPDGTLVLGYDDRGHCPMLVDGACSIYAHRPRTCRTYDCRVFAAAGVEPDDKPEIAGRVRQWRFAHPTELDEPLHAAVQAAARFVRERPDELGGRPVPANATQLAVLAIRMVVTQD